MLGVLSVVPVPFATSQRVSLLLSGAFTESLQVEFADEREINMFSSHPEVPLKTPAGILVQPASLIAIHILIAEAKVTAWPRA